jgi:hypothetical protein
MTSKKSTLSPEQDTQTYAMIKKPREYYQQAPWAAKKFPFLNQQECWQI